MPPLSHPLINGTHACLDFSGCNVDKLDDEAYLIELIRKGASDSGATILSVQSHKFHPQGVTVLMMIAESHISIHTWPEHAFAAADVFTCGPSMDTDKICGILEAGLEATHTVKTMVSRGLPSDESLKA